MYNSSELEHLQYQRNIAYNNNDDKLANEIQDQINNFKPQTSLN